MYATKENKSFLIEAKSIENRNFKDQSRKAIAQLFEYDYFEIQDFKTKNGLNVKDESKFLITSKLPKDEGYINFINSLHIKTAAVVKEQIVPYGDSINFTTL